MPANTAKNPLYSKHLSTPIAGTANITSDSLTSPQSHQLQSLDPITESNFNARKASLNLPSQRKALALYNAPVVKECYKRVISHFKKPKNSYTPGQKLNPIQNTTVMPSSLKEPQQQKSVNRNTNFEFLAMPVSPPDDGLTFGHTEVENLVDKGGDELDERRKRMDLNAITPNLISDQDRSDNNGTPIGERVLNLSYRNSPNAERLKLYFEKKGQQE